MRKYRISATLITGIKSNNLLLTVKISNNFPGYIKKRIDIDRKQVYYCINPLIQ